MVAQADSNNTLHAAAPARDVARALEPRPEAAVWASARLQRCSCSGPALVRGRCSRDAAAVITAVAVLLPTESASNAPFDATPADLNAEAEHIVLGLAVAGAGMPLPAAIAPVVFVDSSLSNRDELLA